MEKKGEEKEERGGKEKERVCHIHGKIYCNTLLQSW